jgi:hypothetical protein
MSKILDDQEDAQHGLARARLALVNANTAIARAQIAYVNAVKGVEHATERIAYRKRLMWVTIRRNESFYCILTNEERNVLIFSLMENALIAAASIQPHFACTDPNHDHGQPRNPACARRARSDRKQGTRHQAAP